MTEARHIMDGYKFHTAPFAHQHTALRRGAGKRAFAFLMDQGLGKTKVTIDNVAALYEHKVVDGVLLLALNGVDEQWLNEQIPLHMPPRIPVRSALWEASSRRRERECTELCTKPLPNRLAILAMNHEALATKRGQAMALRFMRQYKVCIVVDESHEFKGMTASRTRFLLGKLAPLSVARRILTGTPTEKPFDIYAQMQFLDPRILGFDSFVAFKRHYGVWTTEFVKRVNPKTGKTFLQPYPSLQQYQRLEELEQRLAKFSYRVKKEDCTDLPPKLYSVRQCTMTDAQRALYNQVKEHGVALLEQAEAGKAVRLLPFDDLDEEDIVAAVATPANRLTYKIKLTLMLRLQQISGGFVTDDAGTVRAIDKEPNHKQRAALSLVEAALDGAAKVVVWCVFRAEVQALAKLLPLATYIDGSVQGAERAARLAAFKDPRCSTVRVMVANERTIGTGQNLQVAQTALYYSNSGRFIRRTQSEDRLHRIGQTGTVNIYDLIASPADARMVQLVRDKEAVNTLLWTPNAAQLKEEL